MNWQIPIGMFLLGISFTFILWGTQINDKGSYFSKTSDGSFVSIKDKWVYYTDSKGKICPIISFDQMHSWNEFEKKVGTGGEG